MKPDLFHYEPYWGKWVFVYNGEIYLLDEEPEGETALKTACNKYPVNGLSVPCKVQIQVTNRCNFACPHCYVSSGNPLPNEMSYEEIEALLYRLRDWGVLQVSWSGGEVFSRKNFLDLVRLSDNLGMENKVLTNGYAIGKVKSIDPNELWELFNSIQISLDGWDYMFNKFVGRNAFPEVLNAIDLLHSCKPKERHLKVATTVSDDMVSYEHIANYLNGRDITWRIAKQVHNGRSEVREQAVNEQLAMTYLIIQSLRQKYDINVLHPYDKYRITDFTMPDEWNVEPGARYFLYIKANGDVYPFPYLDGMTDYLAGNVLTDDLDQIWWSAEFNDYRKPTKENTGCGGCPYVCQMWIRSFNTDDLYATPPKHPNCFRN